MKATALVVGAHDDDAVAWMGGTIRQLSEWQWTVISLCRWIGRQEPNHGYFKRTCELLGVTTRIAGDFVDDQSSRHNDVQSMKNFITKEVQNTIFDYVFTHSRAPGGEYGGHANHDDTREAVVSLVQEGRLAANTLNIVYFAYKNCHPDPAAPFRIELTEREVQFKKQALASPVIRKDMEALGLCDSKSNEIRCDRWETFDTDSPTMPLPFTANPD
jgi:LmbE family N-acetylglucosaminyl deacetylase